MSGWPPTGLHCANLTICAREPTSRRCCRGLSCIAGAHGRRSRMRRRLDAPRAFATSASAAKPELVNNDVRVLERAANASHPGARVTTTPVVSCAI
jgi:hypothetical protein